jgi:hypothetical protein
VPHIRIDAALSDSNRESRDDCSGEVVRIFPPRIVDARFDEWRKFFQITIEIRNLNFTKDLCAQNKAFAGKTR